MRSITRRSLFVFLSAIAWLFAWYLVSLLIGEELFLPSPFKVLRTLFSLMGEMGFWRSVLFSVVRVALGFLIALFLSVHLSVASYSSFAIEIALEPVISTVRSTPVASIIILVLVWIRSKNLSIAISALIVFPVMYTNLLEGMKSTPIDIKEMAKAYRIGFFKRIRYIYIPYIMPYFVSGIKTALGLGWKSAIAAEVIGLPFGSIGENLYMSKVYLDTPSLFAWTLVIILLAVFFERFFLFLTKMLVRRLSR